MLALLLCLMISLERAAQCLYLWGGGGGEKRVYVIAPTDPIVNVCS